MFLFRRSLTKNSFKSSFRFFSQLVPDQGMGELHRKRESTNILDPDLIFDDTFVTNEGLLDVKPLFQEYSADQKLDSKSFERLANYNQEVIQEFERKYLQNRNIQPEDLHYTHVADNQVANEDQAPFFRFPRTEPYRRTPAGELYRVPSDSYKQINAERSKSFASELFPPYNLKEETLLQIQDQLKDPEADRDQIIHTLREIIPKLNYNLIPDLALFLAFDAQISDPQVWRLISESVVG